MHFLWKPIATKLTILRSKRSLGLCELSVVLTIDDGPNPYHHVTERLLAVLKRHGIRAYFCLIGKYVAENPDLVRLIHAHGHFLVNHSFSHQHPTRQSVQTLTADFDQCDRQIAKALGISDFQTQYKTSIRDHYAPH